MSGNPPDDGTLMTLAGIAYGNAASIAGYLSEAGPTVGWTLAWMPRTSDADDFCFAATSPDRSATVIAIRGTYPDPFSRAYWDDAAQDSPFGTMVEWPVGSGARISAGTSAALSGLLSLADGAGGDLRTFVDALPEDSLVVVVGHSLGGTLAPVLALQLASWRLDLVVHATSFAGMTPGDGAFAELVTKQIGTNGRLRRVFNTLDTVSYGWDDVLATSDFYQPAPQGGPLVEGMLRLVAERLADGNYGYAAVGVPVPLEGSISSGAKPWGPFGYVFENLHQHMPDTYLSLLSAPPLPFTIGFGSVIRERVESVKGAGLVALRPSRPGDRTA